MQFGTNIHKKIFQILITLYERSQFNSLFRRFARIILGIWNFFSSFFPSKVCLEYKQDIFGLSFFKKIPDYMPKVSRRFPNTQYTHQTPNVKACLTGCLIYQSRWMAACLIARSKLRYSNWLRIGCCLLQRSGSKEWIRNSCEAVYCPNVSFFVILN